jgi:hypothetical protein
VSLIIKRELDEKTQPRIVTSRAGIKQWVRRRFKKNVRAIWKSFRAGA